MFIKSKEGTCIIVSGKFEDDLKRDTRNEPIIIKSQWRYRSQRT